MDVKFWNELGIDPVSEFLFKQSLSKLYLSKPSDSGMVPLKRLLLANSSESLERFPNDRGMLPVRKLSDISRVLKLVRSPIESRMGPDSRLLLSIKTDKRLRFPMLEGMLPVSPLESKYKAVKLCRFPMDSGIGPVSRCPERDKDYNPCR